MIRGTSSIVEKNQEKGFDQFYTKDAVAEECLADLVDILDQASGYNLDGVCFLEPSAGGGAFLRALEKANYKKYYACDIDPKDSKIVKRDFLNGDISSELPGKESVVVIGNPPFGRRARMAAAFINKALEYTDTVAFILPLQFQKYSAQNKLIESARLVFDKTLTPESFVFNGKPYVVRCCFQVWTNRDFGTDIRLRNPPITKHQDFEMWQYNNTREAEKYFDKAKYQWDFAIPRQGYKDYSLRVTDPEMMDRHTQWIFFKAKNDEIKRRLLSIDYDKLSHKNISIPGFGKADVITEYEELFGEYTESKKIIETLSTGNQEEVGGEAATQESSQVVLSFPLDNLLDYQ